MFAKGMSQKSNSFPEHTETICTSTDVLTENPPASPKCILAYKDSERRAEKSENKLAKFSKLSRAEAYLLQRYEYNGY